MKISRHPEPEPRGDHLVCERSDLYAGEVIATDLGGDQACPEHGREPWVRLDGTRVSCLRRCWGRDADPKGPRPPCMACVRGTEVARSYAERFRGPEPATVTGLEARAEAGAVTAGGVYEPTYWLEATHAHGRTLIRNVTVTQLRLLITEHFEHSAIRHGVEPPPDFIIRRRNS